jgi:hypothetical protein
MEVNASKHVQVVIIVLIRDVKAVQAYVKPVTYTTIRFGAQTANQEIISMVMIVYPNAHKTQHFRIRSVYRKVA